MGSEGQKHRQVLLALRKQMIRGDGGGLCHVAALLSQRGVHMPAKRKDVAGNWLWPYGYAGSTGRALPFRGVVNQIALLEFLPV